MAGVDAFGIRYDDVYVDPKEKARRIAAAKDREQQGLAALLGQQIAAQLPPPNPNAPTQSQVNGPPGYGVPDPVPVAGSIDDQTGPSEGRKGPIPRDPRDFTGTDMVEYLLKGAGQGRPDPFDSPAYPGGRTGQQAPVPVIPDQTGPRPGGPAPGEAPVQGPPMVPTAPNVADPSLTQPIQTGQVPDPNQQIADIAAQKEMLNGLYPQLDVSNPYADKAMDYADKELDRSRLMAQLAFFAGITKGAGGQWEAVGQGLAAGGDAYDKGFGRYQKALENRAKRYSDDKRDVYDADVAKTNAAVNLYTQNQKIDIDRDTLSRQEVKDRRDAIDKHFSTTKPPTNDMDLNNEAYEKWKRDYEASVAAGKVVSTVDVRDKP